MMKAHISEPALNSIVQAFLESLDDEAPFTDRGATAREDAEDTMNAFMAFTYKEDREKAERYAEYLKLKKEFENEDTTA